MSVHTHSQFHKTALLAGSLTLAGLLSGCAQTRYVAVPVAPAPPGGPILDACTSHAAHAQRAAFGDEFRGLQLNTTHAVLAETTAPVGNQPVAAAFDGEGVWFGRPHGTQGEWRKVRYHCLFSPAGQVVYSFVRAQ